MTTDPIRKSVTVPLAPDDAFELFTAELESWWPAESHSLSAGRGERPAAIEVEPRTGGQILETLPDGQRAPWGRVTRWEAGRAFGVAWHVGRDEAEATALLVTFTPVADGTRVDLEHGGFDRLGATAATAAIGEYRQGWDLVLGRCYVAQCRRRCTVAATGG